MEKFKYYNGSTWCDPCKRPIAIKDSNVAWQDVMYSDKASYYYDGAQWQRIFCGLECGNDISFTEALGTGVYYIPLYMPAGVISFDISFDASTSQDAIQIVSEDKGTLLEDSGFYGTNVADWVAIDALTDLTYEYHVFEYDPVTSAFVSNPVDEVITLTDSASTLVTEVYIPAPGSGPRATTTVTLSHTRVDSTIEETYYIKIITAPVVMADWDINSIVCTTSLVKAPSEVTFTVPADYIVLSYKYNKLSATAINTEDYWLDGSGDNIYDDYAAEPIGTQLRTHTRVGGGSDENTLTVESHYFGHTARTSVNDAPFPIYAQDGVTENSQNGDGVNIPVIPLDDEFIIRYSGTAVDADYESILINVKEFKARFGPATAMNLAILQAECRAWWLSTGVPSDYPVSVTITFYEDDALNHITDITLNDQGFRVTGGIKTIVRTPPMVVDKVDYYNVDGQELATPKRSERVGVFVYDLTSNSGIFTVANSTLNTPVTATGSAAPSIPLGI